MTETAEARIARIDERTALMERYLREWVEEDKRVHRMHSRILAILGIMIIINLLGGDDAVRTFIAQALAATF